MVTVTWTQLIVVLVVALYVLYRIISRPQSDASPGIVAQPEERLTPCLCCETPAGKICGETSPDKEWICTRHEGHVGPHVACGITHACSVWRDEIETGVLA